MNNICVIYLIEKSQSCYVKRREIKLPVRYYNIIEFFF